MKASPSIGMHGPTILHRLFQLLATSDLYFDVILFDSLGTDARCYRVGLAPSFMLIRCVGEGEGNGIWQAASSHGIVKGDRSSGS